MAGLPTAELPAIGVSSILYLAELAPEDDVGGAGDGDGCGAGRFLLWESLDF